jgi:hypothetical protein
MKRLSVLLLLSILGCDNPGSAPASATQKSEPRYTVKVGWGSEEQTYQATRVDYDGYFHHVDFDTPEGERITATNYVVIKHK